MFVRYFIFCQCIFFQRRTISLNIVFETILLLKHAEWYVHMSVYSALTISGILLRWPFSIVKARKSLVEDPIVCGYAKIYYRRVK